MTEQIITKNFYNIISAGGGGSANSDSAFIWLMPTGLSRETATSDSTQIWSFKKPDKDTMQSYHKIYPVKYSKSLSEMTETEIYGVPYEELKDADNTHINYNITDSSTGLITGIKLTTTHINKSAQNETINGILYQMLNNTSSSAKKYNLILTKFDTPITIAPTESYQFTLDLDNIFQSFPATIGS